MSAPYIPETGTAYESIPLRNRQGHIIAETLVDVTDMDVVEMYCWHREAHGYASTMIPHPQAEVAANWRRSNMQYAVD